MIKEMLFTINHALADGEMTIDCAKKLLKNLSALTGKEYCILNMRAAYKDEYTGKIHDAWVNA